MPRMNQQQLRKRKHTILLAATMLAMEPGGWTRLTRSAIADLAGCSDGLVSNYLGSMEELRKALIKLAIRQENYPLLAQAIAAGEPSIPKPIRVRAFDHLSA